MRKFSNFENFRFFFFGNFRWIYNLILLVFLICQNSSEFLCATCPSIKIFIGDNSLMRKVLKFSLLDILEHLAWKNHFPFEGTKMVIAKSTLFHFRWIYNLILHVSWYVKIRRNFYVSHVRTSKFLLKTIFWCLKC